MDEVTRIDEQEPRPLLTEDEAEALIMSVLLSGSERGEAISEEKLIAVCEWGTLTLVNYITFKLVMEGKIQIWDVDESGDPIFKIAGMKLVPRTALIEELESYIQQRFSQDDGG